MSKAEGMHIVSPFQTCPHQQIPSLLMMHVPVPQHLISSLMCNPFYMFSNLLCGDLQFADREISSQDISVHDAWLICL
jgi:hypothetical protein